MPDHYEMQDEETSVISYDISVIPNDFNVMTINSLIESGIISMPTFQRNYVWDRKRASRFIESLILGLPIPQIFLYQIERNKYSIIDGQQRLLTIYFLPSNVSQEVESVRFCERFLMKMGKFLITFYLTMNSFKILNYNLLSKKTVSLIL